MKVISLNCFLLIALAPMLKPREIELKDLVMTEKKEHEERLGQYWNRQSKLARSISKNLKGPQ